MSGEDGTRSANEFQDLQGALKDYQEQSHKAELHRRRENVQVLIALALIGGYISFESSRTEFFNTALSESLVLASVAISGLFLLVKMTTITLRPDFDHPRIILFDELIAPMLYTLSVYGLLAIAGITALLNYWNQIPADIRTFAQGLVFAFAFVGVLVYMALLQISRTAKGEEELKQELAATLALLKNEGVISEGKSEEFTKRFNRVFVGEQDFGLLEGLMTVFGNGDSPFILNRTDRRRLRNINERIRIRMGQGNSVSEDIEKINELLTNIEER